MASEASAYLHRLYADWTARMAADPAMSLSALRGIFDEWGKPAFEPEDVTYRSGQVGGVAAIWAEPKDATPEKLLIYTHGGGFAVGSADSHRKLAAHLAKALGMRALVLDYRLAPEHPFPAQIEDVLNVYRALTASGQKPHDLVMAGDSAGGNLAIGSVMKMRDLKLALPRAIIVFSPWLDMELTGPTLESNAASDALVSRGVVEAMVGMFLGGTTPPSDPIANPLRNSLKGLPPLYINAGSVETLLSDAIRLHEMATAAGVDTRLSVVEGMQHVFPCLAGRAPEADAELRQIAEWMETR